ncbi:MAG TPA: recombinase family protein [Fimbriimonadaceae bacterium]|nr:recombinase family protein [Fimbriimonadaceae bacterium]
MRIAIYARKSSESEDRQVQSLDDQLTILTSMAEREGYEVVEVLRESKSAKDPGARPEFARLVHLIESGRLDGILTWHINRLARNMIDGGKIAHMLHEKQFSFIRTPDRIFRPDDNVLLIAIENATATNFIHDLRKNVARGMDSKAARGWFPGRAPLGYRNNLYTNEIEPDPERFDLVRKGWDMLLTGGTTQAEAYRQLLTSGLTMYGKGNKKRPLRQKSAYDIFSNIFYCGEFVFKGQTFKGLHKPMISREEYDLVQKLISREQPRPLRRKHNAVYSGLFRCSTCGHQIIADVKRKLNKATGDIVTYIYYRCSGHSGCTKHGTREDVITAQAKAILDAIKLTPAQASWCKDVLHRHFEQHATESASAYAEAARIAKESRRRLDSLTMLYVDGEIGKEEYQRSKRSLSGQLAEAESRAELLLNRDQQALLWIDKQVEAALQSSMFELGDTNLRRSMLVSVGASRRLDPRSMHISVCPVIKKIASFEPLKLISQSSKVDDFASLNLHWGDWCEEIRTLCYEHIDGLDECQSHGSCRNEA